MKNNFTFSIFAAAGIIAFSSAVYSQNKEIQSGSTDVSAFRCGQAQYENYLRSQDPDYDKKRAAFEMKIQKYIQKQQEAKLNGTAPANVVYTIPIVVHILWNTAAQNVSDAKVISMVDQLNKDWRRQNSDTANTPSVWKPIAADMEINFCLATTDPSGNPTTGIIHKQTTQTSFSTNDAIKYSSQGGDDAWDPNKYFNIWVGNLSGGLLGYANFPPPNAAFGTVIHYCTVGSMTNPGTCPPFALGRTLSHEIGHNFTLQHIWDGGCPAGGDGVLDTPGQAGPTSGCPAFPALDACQTASPGYMFMNYMDYTDDACYNMFTQGQKTKCQNTIAASLMSIANNSSVVCGPAAALDAGINSIVAPSGFACNTTFTPVVKLQNYGSSTLTSCTINYRIDNNPNQTFNWTGSLAQGQSNNVTLPTMTTTAGTHTFTSFTSNPNGSTDGNTGNDQSSVAFTVSGSAQALPIVEGMEGATFPPSGWTLNNPDGGITWVRTTTTAKTGTASMYIDNYNYNSNGQVDEFTSPPLDFSLATSGQITFELAYQMYSNPATYLSSDTLKVWISTDCGVTWTEVYNKYHTQLITATPQYSTVAFTPTASQWRMETINLTPYVPAATMLVKFRQITDYENNLYVDDINITSVVGVNEYNLNNYVQVYPNPSPGNINVLITAQNPGKTQITVRNVLGQKVMQVEDEISSPKKFVLDVSTYPDALYFVEVKTEGGSALKKILVSK